MVDITSPWYPYQKVQESYYDLSETENIPRKICDYLIDAPKGNYEPKDDNSYARCRLWKYLYYDGEKPLNEKLPSIDEKMSVVFDATNPTSPPGEKGYRLIPQIYVKEAQEDAKTMINVYMGRTIPGDDEFKVSLSVVFDIWTHYTYEANTKSDEYSRAFAIEQAIVEALHGVNMAGIGTFYFSKSKHPDCGSKAAYDNNSNVGRELILALEIATNSKRGTGETSNMPYFNNNSNIKLW